MGLLSIDMGSLRGRGPLVKAGAVAAAAAVVLFAGYALYSKAAAAKRLAGVKKADLEAFTRLSGEYIRKRSDLDALSRKAYAPSGGLSAVAVIQEFAAKAGLADRVASLKATGVEEPLGYTSTGLDMVIEKADLNRIVNLLYLVEQGPRLFVIDEFSLKSRFDDPKLLDLRLKLKHLSKKPA